MLKMWLNLPVTLLIQLTEVHSLLFDRFIALN